MAEATVLFHLGPETATSVLEIDLAVGTPILGDFAGLIPPGTTARIVGNVNQTGDVFVEGLLTGIDTFHWQGNGFTVFFQNGGRADLHGKVKASWGPWGGDSTGWVAGDRIAIAPTADGVFVPSEAVWSDWNMARPSASPDVTLLDSRVVSPEVVNLSQSIVFENLSRGFHVHDSGGVMTLSDIKMLNCGTAGVLGHYSVHFHMVGEAARGSLVERVVVEGSKFRAFVAHASHGVTMRDCVSYKQIGGEAFWWDPPDASAPGPTKNHTANNSNDITWEHCLALAGSDRPAFVLGAGSGNRCIDSVAACRKLGFFWSNEANQNVGGNVWEFHDNVAHNCGISEGIRAWQNDFNDHHNTDLIIYNCAEVGLGVGAYNNNYRFSRMVIQGCDIAIVQAALGAVHTDVLSDGMLVIDAHNGGGGGFEIVRSTFSKVWYRADAGDVPSTGRFVDCGLTPADFDLVSQGPTKPGIHPQSVIEVIEAGTIVHRWASGVWS